MLNKVLFQSIIITILFVILFSFTACSRKTDNNITKNDLSEGIIVGNNSSSLQVVEYSSFQCPDCKKLHQNIQETLQEYVNEGKMFYVFKPIDIKRFSYDQYIYANLPIKNENLDMIKEIFDKQDQWSKSGTEEEIKQILGFEDVSKETLKKRKETMENIKKELKNKKINEVPVFYINGKKFVGVYSKEEFQKLLENAKTK